jgi:nucleotide-binding universal stress UspA family protein
VIVPYIQKDGFSTKRVMVCWDGSKSAARAIADALPILRGANQIDVVTIDHTDRRNVLPGVQIAEHLARHELRVNLRTVVAPECDVASALLSEAADSETTFMVMGGYGHSRLREFVLGGVTREILQSMTVPVLMAH